MIRQVKQPTEPTTRLGEIIEQRRLELGLTKSEAARRAGVSRMTWHEIEAGRRSNMLADTLNLFDKALGFERGRLRSLSRPMERRPDVVIAPAGSPLVEAPAHTDVDQAVVDRQRLAALAISLPAEQVSRLVHLIDAGEPLAAEGTDLAAVTEKLDEILRRLEERTPAHDRPSRARPQSRGGESPAPGTGSPPGRLA